MEKGIVYINGAFHGVDDAKVSVFDQGFIFGDGVFDTFVVLHGYIFKADEHLDRFYRSAQAVRIKMPLTKEELRGVIIETVKRTGFMDAYIKCIVTRGVGSKPILGRGDTPKPTLVVFAVPPLSVVDQEKIRNGAKLVSTTIRRAPPETLDPRIKSINYQPNMLMRREAIAAGADEAVSYDHEGNVAEGGVENIFLVKNDVLFTLASGVLEGITRQTVIEIAQENGMGCVEGNLKKYDVYNSDEVFLCSTAGGVVPVTEVDNVAIGDGKPGPVARKIMETYDQMLREGIHGTPVYA